ncbi:hypothetical protein BDN72DRAFT_858308 [Pluteus cervinus]|uniref:Uncharacterized protein n=1 Tax=Pluteus cervinus TaxID=181527 RepID=A0ACD3ARM4_9AGAR|nr:hypothetical protein BDN72DRAFT_858308 [Pluteus cervinus]
MALAGKGLEKDVGQWSGLSTAAGAMNSFPGCGLGVALAVDGTLYQSGAYAALQGATDLVRSPRRHGSRRFTPSRNPLVSLVVVQAECAGTNAPIIQEVVLMVASFNKSTNRTVAAWQLELFTRTLSSTIPIQPQTNWTLQCQCWTWWWSNPKSIEHDEEVAVTTIGFTAEYVFDTSVVGVAPPATSLGFCVGPLQKEFSTASTTTGESVAESFVAGTDGTSDSGVGVGGHAVSVHVSGVNEASGAPTTLATQAPNTEEDLDMKDLVMNIISPRSNPSGADLALQKAIGKSRRWKDTGEAEQSTKIGVNAFVVGWEGQVADTQPSPLRNHTRLRRYRFPTTMSLSYRPCGRPQKCLQVPSPNRLSEQPPASPVTGHLIRLVDAHVITLRLHPFVPTIVKVKNSLLAILSTASPDDKSRIYLAYPSYHYLHKCDFKTPSGPNYPCIQDILYLLYKAVS